MLRWDFVVAAALIESSTKDLCSPDDRSFFSNPSIEYLNEDVCFAGLFHSIYGTKYFRHETTSDRNSIRKLIGERAERLAWKFCELDRNNFDWGDEDASDLYAIMEANKVSQNV